jgi:hypothetical protein
MSRPSAWTPAWPEAHCRGYGLTLSGPGQPPSSERRAGGGSSSYNFPLLFDYAPSPLCCEMRRAHPGCGHLAVPLHSLRAPTQSVC